MCRVKIPPSSKKFRCSILVSKADFFFFFSIRWSNPNGTNRPALLALLLIHTAGSTVAPLRFSLFLSLVGCTCDYTSAYLMGRVARGRYLSATPRPLRPSAIPLLNREHLAIYSRCTVSRFPERLCVWQNGCHENRVPFFFVFFLPLTLSLSLSPSSAYHRVTFLIPIARIYSPRGSTEVLFFPLLLFFFLSFFPFSSSKRR